MLSTPNRLFTPIKVEIKGESMDPSLGFNTLSDSARLPGWAAAAAAELQPIARALGGVYYPQPRAVPQC